MKRSINILSILLFIAALFLFALIGASHHINFNNSETQVLLGACCVFIANAISLWIYKRDKSFSLRTKVMALTIGSLVCVVYILCKIEWENIQWKEFLVPCCILLALVFLLVKVLYGLLSIRIRGIIIQKEAIENLSSILKLNVTGREQDWDLEAADRFRITEFVALAKSGSLSPYEKYALMSLILTSYDDLLEVEGDKNNELWFAITGLLDVEPELYDDILQFWAREKETNKENMFLLTPLVRTYLSR